MKKLNWQTLFRKSGPLLWLSLILTACVGAREAEPLPTPEPTPEPTTVPTVSTPAETGPEPTRIPPDKYADLEIVTLLPRDAIPAIDDPQFMPITEADDFYDPDELVIGVEFNGDARAYSIPFLSNREIVNDTVGGVKIAVTW